ncbi:MAG: hypothetical protein RL556_15 [Actinomycetota bacterium]|jgi:uncharacterized membrane protein YhaH (DUF805 family)
MALSITFADAVKLGLKKYKTLKGVSSRTEYWYFQLFRILVLLVASVIDSVIGKSADTMFGSGGFLTNVLTAALLIPDISITVRRFKDAGFSGHWLWGQLVLSAAVVFFFVEMMLSPGVMTLIQQGSAANQAQAESVVMAIPGWIMGGFGISLLAAAGYGIFNFIITLRATKTAAQGNKYASTELFIEGTTA